MHLYILYIDTKNIYKEKKKRRKSKKNKLGLKNPKFSAQLPASGGYFLQLNVSKNSIHITIFKR